MLAFDCSNFRTMASKEGSTEAQASEATEDDDDVPELQGREWEFLEKVR